MLPHCSSRKRPTALELEWAVELMVERQHWPSQSSPKSQKAFPKSSYRDFSSTCNSTRRHRQTNSGATPEQTRLSSDSTAVPHRYWAHASSNGSKSNKPPCIST